mmetsp:Transcript_5158/g.20011  ORF Transcript_5158/g.20011 Transcript_5158/m.20011 type:complete len:153 (-) Transcript_5158:270-728(-)
MTHLASILALLLKIQATRSCAGVSLRTQELYAIVFVTRYLDLFFSFISVYNSIMKLFFICSSCCIIWYMRQHRVVSQTYDREQDTFRIIFLVLPCSLLSVFINHEFSAVEILWTFSIYLEAVAIQQLCFPTRWLPCTVFAQLDIPILYRTRI